MAEFYRLKIALNPGSGTITVNGVAPELYYESGTSLTIAVTLDSGWNSIEWFSAGVSLSTSSSFVVSMPDRDFSVRGVADGDFAPVDGYQLLFWGEIQDVGNFNLLRLEIYEDDFGGSDTEVQITELIVNFGDNSKKLTQTILGTSMDFTLIGVSTQYDMFLGGDIRTFRTILKRSGNIVFDGYLTPDFIEYDDLDGNQYYSFVAIDGMKGFDAFRVDPFIFQGGTSGVRDKALNAIVSSLNQTFVEGKKVNFICNIHEDRMDDTELLFTQFFTPESSIFTDGERVKFENGNIIYNETTSIEETIESLLNPFMCRVFQWDNEYWVIRIPDMYQNSMSGFRYLPNTDFDDDITIVNDTPINCLISPKPRIKSGRVYTEFDAFLNLGILALATKGAIYDSKFNLDDWFLTSPATPSYPNTHKLRLWEYVNAKPTGQPETYPSGEVALVQYASELNSENCKIWTTTTTAGLSDTNLSSIYLTTQNTGIGFVIADEVANKLSIELEFMVAAVRSGLTNVFTNHSVAFQVKVGDYYLAESATPEVYEFTLTPSFCVFPVTNIYVFNKISITNVIIPTTDFVEVNLYQLILNSGTRHMFAVCYRNFKLSIEQNEALTLSQIGAKGVTEKRYSSVFPEYNTNIGDAVTNMSTSAIKLNITGTPVSESWTGKDFVSLSLLGAIVQDLANLYGRTNRVISGTIIKSEVKPYEALVYDGSLWVILSMRWNVHTNTYQFEAFELGLIPST